MTDTQFSFISNDPPEFIWEQFDCMFIKPTKFEALLVDYDGEEPIYEYTIDGIPTQFAFELATLVSVLKI